MLYTCEACSRKREARHPTIRLHLSIHESVDVIAKNKLVAHRGDPFNFPENTVEGMNAAATAGASYAELDIQYTADFVPLLYHDPDLQKISGDPRVLAQTPWNEISQLPANYPERFGTAFDDTRISTLSDLVAASANWPAMSLFVELKIESINHFGSERIVDDVFEKISDMISRNQVAAVISKHDVALQQMRQRSGLPIGWVVPDYNEANQSRAKDMNFEFMFINQTRLGAWHAGHEKSETWVVYTVNDLEAAERYLDSGADMIETDVFGKLAK